jgi:hypothetical protein
MYAGPAIKINLIRKRKRLVRKKKRKVDRRNMQ